MYISCNWENTRIAQNKKEYRSELFSREFWDFLELGVFPPKNF